MQKNSFVFGLAFLFLLPAIVVHAEEAPATAQEFEAGRDYRRVTPAQPTDAAPGQVEVLEFFWYGCPHCYQAEAHVIEWLETKPEGVTFTRVPATLNRGWVLMAQAYYTAEELGVLDVMHPALFAAFHETRVPLQTPEALVGYFQQHADVVPADFVAAFNSPTVASKVQRADALARRYAVRGVPTMTVNGKFATNPTMTRGYARMTEVVDALAKQELASQGE
ncbi:MAG TPA: thiol:disulfide interchange protein DsbA/DsbL [Gammaproteobacteria bacterium]